MKKITLLFACITSFVKLAMAQSFSNTEVSFKSPDNKITYGGTLSVPTGNKKYPALIFISGTGKQDRDGLMAGHKVFLEIATELAKNGYAVLRLDDRGVGKTSGTYEAATTADFANDALLAVQYLKTNKQVNTKKIGFIGHSEGGAIMSIAAPQSKDVRYLISLSGLAMNGYDALMSQNQKIVAESQLPDYDKARSNDINTLMFNVALKYADSTNMEEKLNETYKAWKAKDDIYFKTLNVQFDHFRFPVYSFVNYAIGPWYRYFIKYDAQKTMSKIKVPVLAINGDKDNYVIGEPNLQNWKNYIAAGGNKNVETHLLKNVNHLLMPCEKCTQAETQTSKNSVSPEVLKIIITWLNKTIK
ncbi:alpha/beta hydrolase family protein [Pedobacter petrophilus]|nr:alpha/beta fold hydrolase [Pedobacter petrophilus]